MTLDVVGDGLWRNAHQAIPVGLAARGPPTQESKRKEHRSNRPCEALQSHSAPHFFDASKGLLGKESVYISEPVDGWSRQSAFPEAVPSMEGRRGGQ